MAENEDIAALLNLAEAARDAHRHAASARTEVVEAQTTFYEKRRVWIEAQEAERTADAALLEAVGSAVQVRREAVAIPGISGGISGFGPTFGGVAHQNIVTEFDHAGDAIPAGGTHGCSVVTPVRVEPMKGFYSPGFNPRDSRTADQWTPEQIAKLKESLSGAGAVDAWPPTADGLRALKAEETRIFAAAHAALTAAPAVDETVLHNAE